MVRGIDPSVGDLVRKAGARPAEGLEKAASRPDGDADDASRGAAASDKVTLGAKAADGTYRKPSARELAMDARMSAMRDLVAKTFEQQGLSFKIDIGGGQTADLSTMSPGQAQGLVADDGYWGVEKTAKRIFDFAVNAAGSDRSKLDEIRKGVLKGYSAAEKAFGGSLPEISGKTLSKVMSMLDEWSKSADSSSAPSSGDGTQAPPA